MRECTIHGAGHQHPAASAGGCSGCPRLSETLWSILAPDELAVLSASRQQHSFGVGDVVLAQGQACRGVHCIESGELAIRKTDEAGNTFLLRFAGPESTVGYRAFFSGRPHAASVEALTACRTCFIPAEVLRDLLRRSNALAGNFLACAARELEEADNSRLRQAFLPVRARFAHLLLCLRERHGNVEPDGTLVISLPLSRQDIASQLGTAPETVARAIRAMGSSGIAHFEGRTVRVPDLDLLLDEVEQVGLH
jgi:CRP-like cAMP-binding protein